jgi:hypothetical protein
MVVLVLLDYAGPKSRTTAARGLDLDPRRWAWMPKQDGEYVRISTDRTGRVSNVLSRAGRFVPEARDLVGILAGPPDSVFAGELEAHTEAGNRLAACRGWRAVHLFDASRYGGRDVSALPFTERYGLLHQAHAAIELDGRRNPWVDDDNGVAHDVRTGRFAKRVPRDIRRLPVVPLARGRGAGEALWRSFVELGGGEGLVACRLDAPLGRRGAKVKLKETSEIDCRVIAVDARAALVEYGGRMFTVGARAGLAVGQVVEVLHDGWFESSSTPRFARISRTRTDLV